MVEAARAIVRVVNKVGSALGSVALFILVVAVIVFVLAGGVDMLECWEKGAEYMEARGAVC